MRYESLVKDIANRCFLQSCEDLSVIPDEALHCVVTSPPYFGLRDYGTGRWEGGDPDCDHKRPLGIVSASTTNSTSPNANHALQPWRNGKCGRCGATRIDEQIGLEESPAAYLERMVRVFRGIRRVLRPDGVVWLNLGDCWNSGTNAARKPSANADHGYWENAGSMGDRRVKVDGLKPKDLVMMPARLALALCDDGWILRDEIIWFKRNPMPESITDRTTRCHEMIYLLAKSNDATFWTHRDGATGTRTKPEPDYRWQDRANSDEETMYEPPDWKTETFYDRRSQKQEKRWRRVNLWEGHDYFYDHYAIREPLESSVSDLRKMIQGDGRMGGRTLENDDPLYKAHGGTNIGRKRGVGGGFDQLRKQDALGDPRKVGFNDRWRETMVAVNPMAGQPTLLDPPAEPEVAPPLAAYSRGVTPENDDANEGFDDRWHRQRRDDYAVVGRNKRSVWDIPTAPFKGAHFATFPTEIPAICIRAGASEFGCCAECGAPRTRLTQRVGGPPTGDHRKKADVRQNPQGRPDGGVGAYGSDLSNIYAQHGYPETHTVGSAASCGCDAPTVPCLVFDPFMGSGTVAEVAEALGRRWVGTELNPEYHAMIRVRTAQQGLFTQ